ncbi:bifunctional UDP-sugar hydrolase/5'-nucleotidase [Ignatzschineria larvae DSM 13226]|uniref:Bifunctional UDP-sugar hydrolase/5'-nucleotidase n=1 Tax=Ignatzschineria larvae DSM 13226 TaxID=1111732 RepID=A0ABZ3BYN2_9GAMM|nr:bifunctional UDP-sugar hydrolase/5'-nucleotidase [Ignatzschineria larvae]
MMILPLINMGRARRSVSRQAILLKAILWLLLIVMLIPIASFAEETEGQIKKVYILHTNDTHARVIGDDVPAKDGKPLDHGLIGYARYKGAINAFKERYPEQVLILDAGDTIHGTNFATLSKGQSVIRLLNEIGLDAMTLGNHEFNYGQEALKAAIAEAQFPVLAANVLNSEDQQPVFESSTILEVNGLKIGVIGLATPETKVKSSPKNTEGLDFVNPAMIAAKEVEELKGQNVDVIVVLSHLGMDDESEITSYSVLDQVADIDLLIDGHSHTLLPKGERYKDTMIASTGNYLENIGLVTLTFTNDQLTDLTAETIDFVHAMQYPVDEEISNAIDAINQENARVTAVEVGTLLNDLNGERENVRGKETDLGQLLADSMLWATDADIALTNGGGIRASIPAGKVTYGDFLTVFPFGGLVTVIEVSGQDIQDALNHGVDAYPAVAGKFPQVAGLTYQLIAPNGDQLEKAHVTNIMIQGKPLDLNATYRLATNDFMAIGGDGYEMFKGKPQLLLQGLMVDILIDYIKTQLMNEQGEFQFQMEAPRLILVE